MSFREMNLWSCTWLARSWSLEIFGCKKGSTSHASSYAYDEIGCAGVYMMLCAVADCQLGKEYLEKNV